MKRLFLSAALIVLAAGCAQNKPAEPQSTAATQASGKPINTYCAVDRGEKIDPEVTYLYNGQVIGFCCEKCIPEFKKNPEKYMKDLK